MVTISNLFPNFHWAKIAANKLIIDPTCASAEQNRGEDADWRLNAFPPYPAHSGSLYNHGAVVVFVLANEFVCRAKRVIIDTS